MMKGRGVEGVRWRWGDVRDLKKRREGEEGDVVEEGGVLEEDGSGDGEVDVAFDKGTMDAMIWGSPWSPPEEVLENTGRYVREVSLIPVSNVHPTGEEKACLLISWLSGPSSPQGRRTISLRYISTTAFHSAVVTREGSGMGGGNGGFGRGGEFV